MRPGESDEWDGHGPEDGQWMDGEEDRFDRSKARAIQAGGLSPTGGLRSGFEDEVDGHLLWIGALALLVPGPYPAGFLGGLLVADSESDDTPAVTINTGVSAGAVFVYTEALAMEPVQVEAGFEDVVELSVRVDQGPVFVEGGLDRDSSLDRRLDGHGPGWYRVRVHAVNRDLEDGEEATAPWEQYLVQAWPEDGCRDALVWREMSRVSATLDDLSEESERPWGSDEAPRIIAMTPDWVEPAPTVHYDRPQIPRPEAVDWSGEEWEELYGEEGPAEPALGLERRYLELLLGRGFVEEDPSDAAVLAAVRLRVTEEQMRERVAGWEAERGAEA
ncbi:hypothetical protein [Galactobacter valiniphilus]|uniref:hypothetical protein n=1 Tax=Galactobacter valiniphilus TaxID=2676122 RepID=UPI0037353919